MSKPEVKYTQLFSRIHLGGPAILCAVGHPNRDRVPDNVPVMTSSVINYDEKTGRIETLNTIYVPDVDYIEAS